MERRKTKLFFLKIKIFFQLYIELMESTTLKPEEVNIKEITIEDKYINYEGKRLLIKTEWLDAFYNKKFDTLKVPLKADNQLRTVCAQVDKLIKKTLPEGTKQTKILKKYDEKEYISPKFNYAVIFNDDGKEVPLKTIQCDTSFQYRFIFSFKPIQTYKEYHGTNLKCVQIQIKGKENEYKKFAFD
jgi:hypothetical protein